MIISKPIFTAMNIQVYTPINRNSCLSIFDSNCPKFFAVEERALFNSFLDNKNLDEYYVLKDDAVVIACGGIFFDTKENCAGLAWGMVHRSFHKKGYGKQLTLFRIEKLMEQFPEVLHKVDTSQHTFGFYESLGFKTMAIIKDGFAPGLDKYVMKKNF